MTTEVGSSIINKKALIVDDDLTVRKMTTIHLSRLGFEVSALKDGAEVIDMYASGKGNFDLIIMDLEMPIINGDQATEALRAMGVECIIIGVTGCSDASRKQSFKEAGLNHLFEKPLNFVGLKSFLEN